MSGKRQKIQYALALVPKGRSEPRFAVTRDRTTRGEASTESPACAEQLMEEVCDRGNLEERGTCSQQQGGPGVDG